MDKVIKDLKKKFLDPTANKYYDKSAPSVTMQEIEMMYRHAQGIAALIEVEEYCEEAAEEVEDNIKDELMGAEKYLNMFMDNRELKYLKMAEDEANHAREFILESKARGDNVDDSLAWHGAIISRIENYKVM